MRYKVTLPDDKVNIPKENFLYQALKLLLSLIFLALVGFGVLTISLRLIVEFLPIKYEQKLINFISFDTEFKDKKSSVYLDEITTSLSRCSKLPYEIKTFIIPLKEPNAFALPGGSIYITEGMLKKFKNQNELVAVLGHEMGHFKNRDHLKTFGSSLIFSLISLMLNQGYGMILNSTLDISNAKFSQSAEFDADAYSLDLMQCAYGSVTGSTKLFSRMKNTTQTWEYFLASHPSFEKRIQKMKECIVEKNYNTTLAVKPLKEKF